MNLADIVGLDEHLPEGDTGVSFGLTSDRRFLEVREDGEFQQASLDRDQVGQLVAWLVEQRAKMTS